MIWGEKNPIFGNTHLFLFGGCFFFKKRFYFLVRHWGYPCSSWIYFFCVFFQDCTMVINSKPSFWVIWDNFFGTFAKHGRVANLSSSMFSQLRIVATPAIARTFLVVQAHHRSEGFALCSAESLQRNVFCWKLHESPVDLCISCSAC